MSLMVELSPHEYEELVGMLKELREASNKLDISFCDLTERGECNLNGSEYEKINNVFIKVDEYLENIIEP